MRNGKEVHELFFDAFRERRILDEEFIKELQEKLTQNTYDTWRYQLGERTGRLAMNYFLVLHNHPLIIIHEEDRKRYYGALEAWDARQDLEPLLIFLREQTTKTWEKQVKRRKQQPVSTVCSREL